MPQDGDEFNFSTSEPIIMGSDDGKLHGGLGLSRPLSGALRWRLDARYHLATSRPSAYYRPCDPASPPAGPFDFCGGPRPALRDELLTGTMGLQWDGLPHARWSPYLLTTVGAALSRLQWNRDHTSSEPNESTWSRGALAGAGIGVRFPLWRHEGFVEVLRYATVNVYSAKYVPLSIGIRF